MATTEACEAHLHQAYKPWLEKSIHKHKEMCGGGLRKLAVKSEWGSSLPLGQHASTKWRDEPHSLFTANLRRPPLHIPLGLWLDCSHDTRFVILVKMSFTDPMVALSTGPRSNFMLLQGILLKSTHALFVGKLVCQILNNINRQAHCQTWPIDF